MWGKNFYHDKSKKITPNSILDVKQSIFVILMVDLPFQILVL